MKDERKQKTRRAALISGLVVLLVAVALVAAAWFSDGYRQDGYRPFGDLDADKVTQIDVEIGRGEGSLRVATTMDAETIGLVVDVLREIEIHDRKRDSPIVGEPTIIFTLSVVSRGTITVGVDGISEVFFLEEELHKGLHRTDRDVCYTLGNMGKRMVYDYAKQTGMLRATVVPPLPAHPMKMPADLDVDAIRRAAAELLSAECGVLGGPVFSAEDIDMRRAEKIHVDPKPSIFMLDTNNFDKIQDHLEDNDYWINLPVYAHGEAHGLKITKTRAEQWYVVSTLDCESYLDLANEFAGISEGRSLLAEVFCFDVPVALYAGDDGDIATLVPLRDVPWSYWPVYEESDRRYFDSISYPAPDDEFARAIFDYPLLKRLARIELAR